jgi:hypothetical protein
MKQLVFISPRSKCCHKLSAVVQVQVPVPRTLSDRVFSCSYAGRSHQLCQHWMSLLGGLIMMLVRACHATCVRSTQGPCDGGACKCRPVMIQPMASILNHAHFARKSFRMSTLRASAPFGQHGPSGGQARAGTVLIDRLEAPSLRGIHPIDAALLDALRLPLSPAHT